MGGDENVHRKNETRSNQANVTELINSMYEELLGMGYLYKDMYEMTLKELDDTIEKRKMFIGYEIYRLAS